MNKNKRKLVRFIVCAILFAGVEITRRTVFTFSFDANVWIGYALYLPPYFLVAYDVLIKAFRNIARGQIFDENFLMMIATFGAFGVQEFSEALAVMLFYQLGELFQDYAVGRSRASIKELMEICPEYANLEGESSVEMVDPDDVVVGSIIVVKPGEKIPLDGIVVDGESMVDTSALTGEPIPRRAAEGDEVISGCVNGSGLLRVKTTKEFDDSTVSRILELVENATGKKAKVENFITKFARVYTPIVTIGAVVLAFVPPLFFGGAFTDWLQRACVFLVISCPCALVISVPLGFFGGIGASSKAGILVKGGNYIEALSGLTTMVFDKTGTLTKGEFVVSEICPVEISEEKLLETAALAEGYSNHPIAVSIKEACKCKENLSKVKNTKDIGGAGIIAETDDGDIILGNKKIMDANGIEVIENNGVGTVVYIARNNVYLGSILISDTVKNGVKEAIRNIKSMGVKSCVMLTGDKKIVSEKVGKDLDIDEVHSELLPQDKVNILEILLEKSKKEGFLGFVGDGINDAPVLARADVGFAMGSMGSDAAIEAADVVIMDDDLNKIGKIIKISRKTMTIVKTNITFALTVKFLVLGLGAFGIANMWAAVFADVGVATLCILNSMRMLRYK